MKKLGILCIALLVLSACGMIAGIIMTDAAQKDCDD